MNESLVDWLRKWLNDQDWPQNRLADKAEISSSQMSRIMNGGRISPELAAKLEPVIHLPAATILQMSGRLDERPATTPRLDEALILLSQLSIDEQEDEVAALRLKVERRKRGRNAGHSTAGVES